MTIELSLVRFVELEAGDENPSMVSAIDSAFWARPWHLFVLSGRSGSFAFISGDDLPARALVGFSSHQVAANVSQPLYSMLRLMAREPWVRHDYLAESKHLHNRVRVQRKSGRWLQPLKLLHQTRDEQFDEGRHHEMSSNKFCFEPRNAPG